MKHVNATNRPLATVAGGVRKVLSGLLIAGALGASGGAVAQSSGQAAASDDTLSWHGITLYGLVDIGLQYETHGAPFSDYHPAGSENIINKNGRQSVFGATPSNMSQSRVGLQGLEPIFDDIAAVFKVETFFNPNTGQISDALKAEVLNNGRAANQQNTDIDSSVAGQAFETAYAGVSSKTYGTLTFGRQTTPLGDGVSKYDPNLGSQAFSLIGMSGTYAGGGDTQDKRLDSSLKYSGIFMDIAHVGLLYKFNGSNGGANTAFQVQVGGEFAGASVDAYYSKIKSAITVSSLSAAQVADLPGLGYSVSNSLSGTISDNTTFALMGLYKIATVKLYAGYEHIKYANPDNPLPAGFTDIGGYTLAFVNNTAYDNDKILNVYWAGVRYTVLPHLDLTAAYYGYHQNAYGTGTNAGCSTNASGTCSGHFSSFSFDADYSFTKHFDAYAGAMWSGVYDGVANGYIYQRDNINPTIGVRYKF